MNQPSEITSHRIWTLGTDIDTDALAPGVYMKLGLDGIAPHCLETLRPEFAREVKVGDMIAAGENFGIGSSREQAAGVLVALGVRAVIAPSFAGLFFRNAFNLGLLLLTTPHAVRLHEGEQIAFEQSSLTLVRETGERIGCAPIPDFLLDMVEAGGLKPQLAKRLARQRKTSP